MPSWINQVHWGDCRELLPRMLTDGQRANLCVTSPPYFGLRDYRILGQIGQERAPQDYIAQLVRVFRIVRELLCDDATLWLVLGDSYAGPGKVSYGIEELVGSEDAQSILAGEGHGRSRRVGSKDLLGIPWRTALALQADGWHLRCDVIWSKPNGRPESATDRPTRSHEYVFLLTKSERYFFDQEAVREPAVSLDPNASSYRPNSAVIARTGRKEYSAKHPMSARSYNPEGRNLRSVWTITTAPFKDAHFATFPLELVSRCIRAGSSSRGHCRSCGRGWLRTGRVAGEERAASGWQPGCGCGEEPVRAIVLDPFMGSGTTAEVATSLGRDFLGCEIQQNYERLNRQRRVTIGMAL